MYQLIFQYILYNEVSQYVPPFVYVINFQTTEPVAIRF